MPLPPLCHLLERHPRTPNSLLSFNIVLGILSWITRNRKHCPLERPPSAGSAARPALLLALPSATPDCLEP